jgi:geranylgeranyl diphosphate synthase type I
VARLEERYLTELEAELHAAVPAEGPANMLYRMMRYHLGWEDRDGNTVDAPAGKRLRPLLCLLVCEGYGTDFRRALPAAAAVELLHNFTLIHDDVQDRSLERRHRPTVWRLWGDAQAINAGDAMHAISRMTILNLAQRGVPLPAVLASAALLDRTCLRICEGQTLDVDFERRSSVDRATYLAMIERKTAALIGCCMEMGALVGGANAEEQARMRELGVAIGLAYQVQDDVLGIWGDPAVTGKPAADDIRDRKKTLPIIHALETASSAERERLTTIMAGESLQEGDVAAVLRILETTGARRAAEDEAARLYEQTERWLTESSLDESARVTLGSLVRSLLQRPS